MPALWLSRLLAASPAPVASVNMTIPPIEIGRPRKFRSASTILKSLSLNGSKTFSADPAPSGATSNNLFDRIKRSCKSAGHSRTYSSTSFDSTTSTLVDAAPKFPDWLMSIDLDASDFISPAHDLWAEVDGVICRNSHKRGVTNSTLRREISALNNDHNAFVMEIAGVIESVEEEAKATIESLNEEKDSAITSLQKKHRSIVCSLQHDNKTAVATLHEEHKSFLASLSQDYKSTVSTLQKQHHAAIATIEQDHTTNLSILKAEHASATFTLKQDHTSAVGSLRETIEHLEAERISTSVAHQQGFQALREAHSSQLSELSANNAGALEEKNVAIASRQKEIESLRDIHSSTSKELCNANTKNSTLKNSIQALRKSKDAALDNLSASSQRLKEQDKVIAASLRDEIKALREANKANIQQVTNTSSCILAEKEVIIQDLKGQLEKASSEHIQKQESMQAEIIDLTLANNDLTARLASSTEAFEHNSRAFTEAKDTAEHNEKAFHEVEDLLKETEEYKGILEEELEVANKERDEAQRKLRDIALDHMYVKNVESNNDKQAAQVRRLLDEKTPIENERIRLHSENLRLKAEISDLKTSNSEIHAFADDVFDQILPLLEDLQTTDITNVSTLAEMTNDKVIAQLADWMSVFMESCNHNITIGRDLVIENRRLVAAAAADRNTINTLREETVTQADRLHDLDTRLQDAQVDAGVAAADLARAQSEIDSLQPQATRTKNLEVEVLQLQDDLTDALTATAPPSWKTVYDDMKKELANRTATVAALTKRLDCAKEAEHAHEACAAKLADKDRQADLNHQITAALHKANHRLAKEVGRLREHAGLPKREYEVDGGKGAFGEKFAPACMRAMFEQMAEYHGYELCDEDYVEADLMDEVAEEMAENEVAPLEEEPRALERVAEGILDRMLAVGRDVLDEGKGIFSIKQRWIEPVAYDGDDEELDLSTSPEAEKEGEETFEAGQKSMRDAVEAVREAERREQEEMAILDEEAF